MKRDNFQNRTGVNSFLPSFLTIQEKKLHWKNCPSLSEKEHKTHRKRPQNVHFALPVGRFTGIHRVGHRGGRRRQRTGPRCPRIDPRGQTSVVIDENILPLEETR